MSAAAELAARTPGNTPRQFTLQRPPWLPQEVWPFDTRALEVNGIRLAVTDAGAGPALLFVHTGLWSLVWRDVMVRLARSFRCITFDAPGTGRSERLSGPQISLGRASEAVTAVIEALDLSDLTLVFHDLGGPVSVAAASQVAGRIRGLAAINTFGWRPEGMGLRGMLALIGSTPMREFDAAVGMLARISSSSFGVGRHMDLDSRIAFRTGLGAAGLRAFHRYMRDARSADALYRNAEAALQGPFKTLPLLTIFGQRNDPFGFQQRWKQLFPQALQVVVPRGNHFPMCDDPELVANSIARWHRERVAIQG